MTGTEDAAPVGAGDRRIVVQSQAGTNVLLLTRGRLVCLVAMGLGGALWTAVATAGFVIGAIGDTGRGAEVEMVEESYRTRIASLERQLIEAEAHRAAAAAQLAVARGALSDRQSELRAARAASVDLGNTVAAMRTKLGRAVAERDAAEDRAGALDVELVALRTDLGGDADQVAALDTVLGAMSDALVDAVEVRDTQAEDLDRMETELATMELKMEISHDRQERMIASLEDAVEVSFRPLEGIFENAGMDVDTLIDGVRSSHTGIGGPDLGSHAALPLMGEPDMDSRVITLMDDMDRLNALRVAAAKVPFAMPVTAPHRFTSGYGYRRDPRGGGRRMHKGIDLAGPRGTPIKATADGVVTFAGRQSGFGKLVKIRHDYGFETFYAHLNKIRVEVGDRIARGDQIGDMGTTGRSTGVHLHYEVRMGGNPVDPLTYIGAAKDVF